MRGGLNNLNALLVSPHILIVKDGAEIKSLQFPYLVRSIAFKF